MKKGPASLVLTLLLSLASPSLLPGWRAQTFSAAGPPGEIPAHQIAALTRQAQENWEDEVAELAFVIVDKDQGSTLRRITRKRKNWQGREGIDQKTVLFLRYPHKYYGFAYLSWSYLDPAAHDRKWLYYAQDPRGRGRKVRSLPYSMGGTFLGFLLEGNDFTYEDLSERSVEADTHRVVGREFYNNKDCYQIESIPQDGSHFYQKKIRWIWKDVWLPIKVDFYDRRGKPFKTQHNHWTRAQGIWTLKQSLMKDLGRGEMTILFTQSVVYNTGLRDSLFVPIALEKAP